MQAKKSVIIGVLSASGYENRRKACLSTWAKLNREDVEIVFLVGSANHHHPTREGDILYCPCPDDYPSLPQKTRWFCLWAIANYEFDYLFKCDDDTFVAIERLLQCGATEDYVGHDMGGYASGGAGYLLNRRAAMSVVGRLFEAVGAEDVLVNAVLKQAHLEFTPDDRFHPWNDRWPTNSNNLITSHYCTPNQMRLIFAGLEKPPVAGSSIPRIFHHIWFGSAPFPDQFRAYLETWRARHPDWEFMMWTEDNLFPLRNQAQFKSAQNFAQQADIARYEILHRYGGIYLDTDFECLDNIESLLDGVECFSAREDEHLLGIGILGATPGHDLFGHVIEQLPTWFAKEGNACQTTGPCLFSHVAQSHADLTIFGPEVFYPIHYTGREWGPIENAHANHHWAHSWK